MGELKTYADERNRLAHDTWVPIAENGRWYLENWGISRNKRDLHRRRLPVDHVEKLYTKILRAHTRLFEFALALGDKGYLYRPFPKPDGRGE